MFGIYVHIPFCLRKCPYCDFYSVALGRGRPPEADYLRALAAQLERDAPAFAGSEVSTVYFGGGTPSLMSPSFFKSVLDEIGGRFEIADGAEVSCEVNPGAADARWFDGARAAGVNRVSIGVQSFDEANLRALGRAHDSRDAMQAVAEAQEAGFAGVGLDLIFGVEGETTAVLEEDVRTAMAFQPGHVSAYQLTVEEGTPLCRAMGDRCSDGFAVDEDQGLAQMRIVARMLSRGGLARYEISNFAREGFECRHNLNCWRYGEYLGLGAAAASFALSSSDASHQSPVTGHEFARRWTQVRDVDAYMRGRGQVETDRIDARTAMGEFCFLGLRKSEGISDRKFEGVFGVSLEEIFGSTAADLEREGLMERSGERLTLTPAGMELSDQVFQRFVV